MNHLFDEEPFNGLPDTTETKKSFFYKYNARLIYYAYTKLADEEKARDVAQDAFLKYFALPHLPPSEEHSKNFLYKCVYNACIDILRHKKVRDRHLKHYTETDFQEDGIDTKIIQSELLNGIAIEIEKLPPACKNIFKLYMEGLETKQIATQLGIDVQTVRNQITNARKQLKMNLGKKGYLKMLLFLLLAHSASHGSTPFPRH